MMGIFDKLFGRSSATQQPAARQFDAEAVRPSLTNLADALGELADAMDTPDSPMHNPGWLGRVRDLRDARGGIRILLKQPTFERDDVFEAVITARPLFRGTPPQQYAHLEALNARVIEAIDAVHEAA